jgi:hypothetical protein
MDDYRDYIVIESCIRKIFNTEYKGPNKIIEFISWSSGILVILTDVIIIITKNKERKKNKEQE